MPAITTFEELPEAVARYLTARAEDDPATAASAFATDGTVVDDGKSYRGRDEITAWIRLSSTEFEYTTTFLGAERVDDGYVVTNHIEGNFPGGAVDLRFRFTLDPDQLIAALTIAPELDGSWAHVPVHDHLSQTSSQ